MTTPIPDLVRGLRRLGLPVELVEIALLIYRFLFLFADTAQAMNNAQAARLGTFGFKRRIQSLGRLIANLLPRSMAQADRMEKGLMSRGWHGDMTVLSLETPINWGTMTVILTLETTVAALGWITL
jgi:cobalt/nickel transport system permease protein